MSDFKEIKVEELTENPFSLIGKDWALVTAGTKEKFNTMTASWGGVGIMWNKPVAFTFIRPQRYTYEFIEENQFYSLSFFDEKYKDALRFCGTKSGRDVDKVKETNLTPAFSDAPYFEEGKVIMICKKLYSQDLTEESILEKGIKGNYLPDGSDFHRMYISEIVKCYVKE